MFRISDHRAVRSLALSIILLLLAMASAGCNGGKPTTAAGKVVAVPPGQSNPVPVYDAKVTMGGKNANTGYDGGFVLRGAATGTKKITVTKSGYLDYNGTVSVLADGSIADPIRIEPLTGEGRCAVKAVGSPGFRDLSDAAILVQDSTEIFGVEVRLVLEDQEGVQYTAGTEMSIEWDGTKLTYTAAGDIWFMGVQTGKTYTFTGMATVTSEPAKVHLTADFATTLPTVEIGENEVTMEIPFDLQLNVSVSVGK